MHHPSAGLSFGGVNFWTQSLPGTAAGKHLMYNNKTGSPSSTGSLEWLDKTGSQHSKPGLVVDLLSGLNVCKQLHPAFKNLASCNRHAYYMSC